MSSINQKELREVKEQFERLIQTYHQAVINRQSNADNYELEVKFGGSDGDFNSIKITNNDYNNVIKTLKSLGFVYNSVGTKAGVNILRAQHVMLDENSELKQTKFIRVEINGDYDIEQYCSKNTISVVENRVNLLRKTTIRIASDDKKEGGDKIIEPVLFKDFNFKVNLKLEKNMARNQGIYKTLIEGYDNLGKTFRYLNRVTFTHSSYPVKIDISIVKSSPGINLRPQRTFKSFRDADLFNQMETYEIEIELDNDKTVTLEVQSIIASLRKVIKFVLSGLQETSYPVSYSEQQNVIGSYMSLIHGDKFIGTGTTSLSGIHFIGYNSVTLQLKNIVQKLPDTSTQVANIRNDYVVTDKADGERRLLFINDTGKVYMITTNMKVIFTGAVTHEKTVFNTLLDGEYIATTDTAFPLLYAAFDVYFLKKTDVRKKPLINMDFSKQDNESRYQILQKIINVLKLCHVSMNISKSNQPGLTSPILVEYKMYYGINKETIFDACEQLLQAKNGRYKTDGCIFTPASLGVGQDTVVDVFLPSKSRMTWYKSFKWKPQDQTTIDFLATTIKDSSQTDIVETIMIGDEIVKYKKLTLRCTFPRKKNGSSNFCDDIVNGNLSKLKKEELGSPMPARFFPSNPYDEDAGIAYIRLHDDNNNMATVNEEYSEIFHDNMIIEFKYDMDAKWPFHWIPIKVRHDKTIEMLKTKKYFGNAYHVANSNWESLHYPITEQMLVDETAVPKTLPSEDVYYKKPNGANLTNNLKQFHNEIKRKLIVSASSQFTDPRLIDLAVGRGGDLHKWTLTNINFVFGIDISSDNLENPYDGACARYVRLCQEQEKNRSFKLKAMFVYGDCSKKIKAEHSNTNSGAMLGERSNRITQAVFGIGSKKAEDIGKGLSEVYGFGNQGFEIASCQFAMHYFFESKETLVGFISNLAECTKIGGYFIGTAYDGKKMFQQLSNLISGESVTIKELDKLIWQIQKKYNHSVFYDDITSLGYKITVFQESINNYVDEYLVNFDYFDKIMAVFGFMKLSDSDIALLNQPNDLIQLKSSLDSFEDIYRSSSNKVAQLSDNEQSISFLNRCFIYKKNLTVNLLTAKQSLEGYDDSAVINLTNNAITTTFSDINAMSSPVSIQEVLILKSDGKKGRLAENKKRKSTVNLKINKETKKSFEKQG